MSPILAAFIRSTAIPSAVAVIAMYFLGGAGEGLKARLQALLVASAYAVGSYFLLDRLHLPPADVNESLSYVALALAAFVAVSPGDMGARYLVRAIFVAFTGGILLWHIRESLSSYVHLRNMAAFFFLGLGVWSIVERAARQVSRPAYVLLPLVAASGTSLLLLFSASAAFSQLVTVLCGIMGVTVVLSLWRPDRVSAFGLSPFLSVFVVSFMAAGHFYLDVNPWRMVYLCWPFLVLWVRPWLPVPRNAVAEAVALGVLAAGPVIYFLWNAYKAAGPLY